MFMKNVFCLVLILSCLNSYSQDVSKEIVKLDIDNECKQYLAKRTFKDEIYSQPLTILTGLYIKAKIILAYKDNFMFDSKGKLIYFDFDQDLFKTYDVKNIYLNIDGKEYILSLLVDFYKNQTINALAETVYTYTLGYVFSDDLRQAIKSSQSIKIELLNNNSKQRKSWEISPSVLNQLTQTCNCFEQYYLPIEKRIEAEKVIAEEEYQKNLKVYETDFRNSKWNESKEFVKISVKDSLIFEKNDALAYSVTLNNDDFSAFYYFNEDRFYQGIYILEEKYINENNFYSKYLELKTILSSKYGEPKKVVKQRSKDLWNKANEIGMAIQTGEYQEYSFWETKTSTIILKIEGENFDSKLTIRYLTKDPLLKLDVNIEEKKRKIEGF